MEQFWELIFSDDEETDEEEEWYSSSLKSFSSFESHDDGVGYFFQKDMNDFFYGNPKYESESDVGAIKKHQRKRTDPRIAKERQNDDGGSTEQEQKPNDSSSFHKIASALSKESESGKDSKSKESIEKSPHNVPIRFVQLTTPRKLIEAPKPVFDRSNSKQKQSKSKIEDVIESGRSKATRKADESSTQDTSIVSSFFGLEQDPSYENDPKVRKPSKRIIRKKDSRNVEKTKKTRNLSLKRLNCYAHHHLNCYAHHHKPEDDAYVSDVGTYHFVPPKTTKNCKSKASLDCTYHGESKTTLDDCRNDNATDSGKWGSWDEMLDQVIQRPPNGSSMASSRCAKQSQSNKPSSREKKVSWWDQVQDRQGSRKDGKSVPVDQQSLAEVFYDKTPVADDHKSLADIRKATRRQRFGRDETSVAVMDQRRLVEVFDFRKVDRQHRLSRRRDEKPVAVDKRSLAEIFDCRKVDRVGNAPTMIDHSMLYESFYRDNYTVLQGRKTLLL